MESKNYLVTTYHRDGSRRHLCHKIDDDRLEIAVEQFQRRVNTVYILDVVELENMETGKRIVIKKENENE